MKLAEKKLVLAAAWMAVVTGAWSTVQRTVAADEPKCPCKATAELRAAEIPFLSKLPHLGRLFISQTPCEQSACPIEGCKSEAFEPMALDLSFPLFPQNWVCDHGGLFAWCVECSEPGCASDKDLETFVIELKPSNKDCKESCAAQACADSDSEPIAKLGLTLAEGQASQCCAASKDGQVAQCCAAPAADKVATYGDSAAQCCATTTDGKVATCCAANAGEKVAQCCATAAQCCATAAQCCAASAECSTSATAQVAACCAQTKDCAGAKSCDDQKEIAVAQCLAEFDLCAESQCGTDCAISCESNRAQEQVRHFAQCHDRMIELSIENATLRTNFEAMQEVLEAHTKMLEQHAAFVEERANLQAKVQMLETLYAERERHFEAVHELAKENQQLKSELESIARQHSQQTQAVELSLDNERLKARLAKYEAAEKSVSTEGRVAKKGKAGRKVR